MKRGAPISRPALRATLHRPRNAIIIAVTGVATVHDDALGPNGHIH
jgi:hypothetical protein